jgi:hypothetical protein
MNSRVLRLRGSTREFPAIRDWELRKARRTAERASQAIPITLDRRITFGVRPFEIAVRHQPGAASVGNKKNKAAA